MTFTKIVLFSGVVLLFAGAGALEWQTAAGLREEIATLRREKRDPARVQPVAGVSKPAEAARDDEHAALVRLRAEIDQLRRRADERARATALASGARATEPEPSILEQLVPCGAWKNAGRATPAAAIETALWAAAGGDVKTLAATLRLGPAERARVEGILQRLPAEMRSRFGSPEEFVALMTTRDVPLGEARIIDPHWPPEAGTWRLAQLRDAEGKFRAVPIALRQESGEWRLTVPAAALDKYAAMLAGATAKDPGK